jgi:hypothetical protein
MIRETFVFDPSPVDVSMSRNDWLQIPLKANLAVAARRSAARRRDELPPPSVLASSVFFGALAAVVQALDNCKEIHFDQIVALAINVLLMNSVGCHGQKEKAAWRIRQQHHRHGGENKSFSQRLSANWTVSDSNTRNSADITEGRDASDIRRRRETADEIHDRKLHGLFFEVINSRNRAHGELDELTRASESVAVRTGAL